MRQKTSYMIVLFTLLLALTGCGSNNAKTPADKPVAPAAKTELRAGSAAAVSDNQDGAGAATQNGAAVQHNDQQTKPDTLVSEDFLMSIEDVFSVTGRGTVVTGVVMSGHVSTDAQVELVGLADEPVTVTVGGIEIFRELLDTAVKGDNVGILLNDIEKSDVQRGQVLAAKGTICAHNTFSADIAFIEKRSDAFFSQGSFTALSNFFATDSNTIYYFGQARPDENDILSVKAKMLAKLPMKEGTPFRVLLDGTSIAVGVVTGVDVDITGISDPNDNSMPNNEAQSETDNTEDGPANYSVQLLSYGTQKVQVIKIIREVTGLGLKEAKELADYTPSIIKDNITQNEAESIKSKLEEAGAAAEIIE